MELFSVVCLLVTVSGWTSAWPRHRDALVALPDNAPLLEIAPLPKTSYRAPLEVLTVVNPWKDSDSSEWEYIHRHPRRMSVHQPSFNTQHETPPPAPAPYHLRVTKGDARAMQDLVEQELLETPVYIGDAIAPRDQKETVFIRNVAQLSENNHPPRNTHINRTSNSTKSHDKRKNIFQLIKHLELALDVRKRKNRPKPSGERYKIRKEHVHNSAALANENHYIKHYLEKSYNRSQMRNNLEASELTLTNNDIHNRKQILSGSGNIQKIVKTQKSEEDWINIATNEVKQDISNSDDVSLLKSVENEGELTDHAIADIIKQLRDILTEDSSDTVNEDSRENLLLLQKYISSELEPELVTPAIQSSQIYTEKPISSLGIDPSLKPVSSITNALDINSVLPLVVHQVSSSTSASVESESDISSSETSHIVDKSSDSDHVSTSDSSYLLPQSHESSSKHYDSEEYFTSPTHASQSQMSGSAQGTSISSASYNLSLDQDSSFGINDNSGHANSDSEMYNKYEKNLAEKVINESFKHSNEVISYLLTSTENSDVLPLTTTEEPILDTRPTLVTESNNIINIYGSSENSVLPKITNSNEIANVTKLYKVSRNFPYKLPSTEIHGLGTVPKDVTDVLTNMLLSDSDIDVSDHVPEQNAIDNLFEDIAQELGETVQLVAKAANANGSARKEADIRNVARNRPDRAIKTYNLAFHFNK